MKYADIQAQQVNIETDIEKVEKTMKQLVVQQLGDKFGFDESLNELSQYKTPGEKLVA